MADRIQFERTIVVDDKVRANARVYLFDLPGGSAVTDLFTAKTGGAAVASLVSNAAGRVVGYFTTPLVGEPRYVRTTVTDNGHTSYLPADPLTPVNFADFSQDDNTIGGDSGVLDKAAMHLAGAENPTGPKTFGPGALLDDGNFFVDARVHGLVDNPALDIDQSAAMLSAANAASVAKGGIVTVPAGWTFKASISTAAHFWQPSFWGMGGEWSNRWEGLGGAPALKYVGGSGSLTGAQAQGFGFTGAAATGIEFNGVGGTYAHKCSFGRLAPLARGVLFHNSVDAMFTEECLADTCDFAETCTQKVEYSNTAPRAVEPNGRSFFGSGCRNSVLVMANLAASGSCILVGNHCSTDGVVWDVKLQCLQATTNTPPIKVLTDFPQVAARGNMRVEAPSSLTIDIVDSASSVQVNYSGNVQMVGEKIRFGKMRRAGVIKINADSSTTAQFEPFQATINVNSNVATNLVELDDGGEYLIGVLARAASGYDYCHALLVWRDPGSPAGTVKHLGSALVNEQSTVVVNSAAATAIKQLLLDGTYDVAVRISAPGGYEYTYHLVVWRDPFTNGGTVLYAGTHVTEGSNAVAQALHINNSAGPGHPQGAPTFDINAYNLRILNTTYALSGGVTVSVSCVQRLNAPRLRAVDGPAGKAQNPAVFDVSGYNLRAQNDTFNTETVTLSLSVQPLVARLTAPIT